MSRLRGNDRIKYAIKCAVAYSMYYLGLLHLLKRIVLRNSAVVLAYHRVLPSEAAARTWSHPAIVVTRETFERHMQVVSRAFKPLNLSEFISRLRGGAPFPPSSCLITFDDGWEDTCTEAWPVLQQYLLPAVVFLPVGLIGSGEPFWQEHLSSLLFETWRRARADVRFDERARPVLAALALSSVLDCSEQEVRERIKALVQKRKGQEQRTRQTVAALTELVGRPEGSGHDRLMCWKQAHMMSCDGVVFGGHGTSHRILTAIPSKEVHDEARTARRVLELELGAKDAAFSYPNGDLNPEVAEAVRQAGFSAAFSMRRGRVRPGDDPLAIRRINMHEDVSRNTPMFLARVLGIF